MDKPEAKTKLAPETKPSTDTRIAVRQWHQHPLPDLADCPEPVREMAAALSQVAKLAATSPDAIVVYLGHPTTARNVVRAVAKLTQTATREAYDRMRKG